MPVWQTPPRHVSNVHDVALAHGVLSGAGWNPQPLPGLHAGTWHGSLDGGQAVAVPPWQEPPRHVSPIKQTLSLQDVPSG
jgi:hypothetical protein